MLNQTKDDDEATEVRYVMNYMDCMENLPNDLQRQLSRMLELDSASQIYVREFDHQRAILSKAISDRAMTKKDTLERIQKLLIHMQDIGDEKLQIMQTIQDLIETKARELDIDYKNLRPKLEQENSEAMNVSNSNSVSSNNKNTSINNDKFSRRGRRTKTDTPVETTSHEADASALTENQSPNLPSTSNGNQKRASTRKKKDTSEQRNQSQDDIPASPENDPNADPDEPTYCICNRISFGKMIMCDNDSCALEWFHFQCVSITSKPKGKWYCPDCRGNKPNIMKTKKRLR